MPYPKKSGEARSIARDRSRQAKWKRVRFRDNRVEETKGASGFSLNECWCGEPDTHDWPGRSEGEPHPNPRTHPDLTPKQQEREAQILLQEAGVCPTCRGYPPHVTFDGWPYCVTCHGTGEFPPPRGASEWRKNHPEAQQKEQHD